MEILKNEYKITKDEDFIGKRFQSYTIEKKITYINGEIEYRHNTFFPFRDGDINKVNLDDLYFPKPITSEEWEELSPEYRQAWIRGTMTEELAKELEDLRAKEGVA